MNAKLVLLLLAPALLEGRIGRHTASRSREAALHLHALDLPETRGDADISPISREVAVYGWAAVPSAQRDPNHYPLHVSIYDYFRPPAPVATMSSLVTLIHWGTPFPTFEDFLRYSPDGRYLLAYDGAGVIHLFELESPQPREVRTIDLGMSAERPNFQPVDVEWSPDSKRAAVIFSFRVFHQGVVRVYDVTTGELQWERSFDLVEMAGEAWSPDRRKLAVTLLSGEPHSAYPDRNITNLLVLDANSGQTILAIRTGDRAGPVCFAPDNAVLTAPLHSLPEGHDRWHHETAEVWDATTGILVRRIASPGRDIHDDLALSGDGKVLLGYVGKEKYGIVLRDMEVEAKVLDRRFQLFDYKTGNVIATSPDLTKGGMCVNHMPSFRLSAHGDRVLVYWPDSGCPPSVFEVSGADY